MTTYRALANLERDFGSPFYLFDQAALVRNFRDLRSAFARHYPQVVIGYSYKTNYLPYLCRLAQEQGAYAEVVSRLELDLALRLGCHPATILFNGPIKSAEDMEFALSRGIFLNLDSFRELDQVAAWARRRPATPVKIGLRVNISLLDSEGRSQLQAGLPVGRFGFTQEGLEEVARRLTEVPNLRVQALHGHTSSATRSLWVYRTIVRRLLEVAEQLFPESITQLNVGGGFFGPSAAVMGVANPPTYEDYARAIGAELQAHPWVRRQQPQLIIEPGLAVVADTMSLVTRVFEVKHLEGRKLAVVDGNIFNVKPTFHPRNHPFQVVTPAGRPETLHRYDVVGSTCMEKDCLLQNIECRELARGDFIHIDNVGAYTIVLGPSFIQPTPPILIREGERYCAIRRRQEFPDVFGTYAF